MNRVRIWALCEAIVLAVLSALLFAHPSTSSTWIAAVLAACAALSASLAFSSGLMRGTMKVAGVCEACGK